MLAGFTASMATFCDTIEGRKKAVGHNTFRASMTSGGRGNHGGATPANNVGAVADATQIVRIHGDATGRAEFCALQFLHEQFVFKPIGSLVFVLNAPCVDGHDMMARLLHELISCLSTLMGPPEKWKTLALDGVRDVIQQILGNELNSPQKLLGGMNLVPKSRFVVEGLDQVLGFLEQDSMTIGTALFIDDAVLHSRLQMAETKRIRSLLSYRPMRHHRIRVTPIFSQGQWKNLVLYRMRWHTLAHLIGVDHGLADALPAVYAFEKLLNARMWQMRVPLANDWVHIDDYCDLDTIAFAYHNFDEGMTLAPSLREDPNKSLHEQIFAWFIKRAQDQMQQHGLSSCHLVKGGYRLYAYEEDRHEMFVMCGSSVSATQLENEADRLVGVCLGPGRGDGTLATHRLALARGVGALRCSFAARLVQRLDLFLGFGSASHVGQNHLDGAAQLSKTEETGFVLKLAQPALVAGKRPALQECQDVAEEEPVPVEEKATVLVGAQHRVLLGEAGGGEEREPVPEKELGCDFEHLPADVEAHQPGGVHLRVAAHREPLVLHGGLEPRALLVQPRALVLQLAPVAPQHRLV
ncbi:Uncharacterized protein SCF082_LOCUS16099, partial [Durusdinium trenchii]